MDAIKPVISAYLGTVNTVGVGSTGAVNQTAPSSPQPQPSTTDSVQFSAAAIEVSKYASLARRIQDHVSPDKIAALKDSVATGQYPAPLVVEGLLSLVGSSLLSQSSSSASSSS